MHKIATMNLFGDHLVEDDRSPTHFRSIGGYRLGLLAPKPAFFLQVIILLLLQMAIANVIAVLCYYGIEKNRNMSFLVTFGIVLPLTAWAPFHVMNLLDIRSTVLRMGLVPLPICVQLKCLQAYFGFTPAVATLSLRNYRCHMGFLMQPKWQNGGAVAATTQFFLASIRSYLSYYMINAILYSLLEPFDYTPFRGATKEAHEIFWSIELAHLCNNFSAAVLVSLSLGFSLSGVSAQLLGGFQCEVVVDHPLFLSTSVSDFWGRRWNRLVHAALKNGVYKPVRSYSNSRSMAAMATFLASGILHEYVWYLLFYTNIHQDDVLAPPFGNQLFFFGWNGILLVMEYAVGWEKLVSTIPKPVVTLLVVLMALPVGHLLTGDMLKGGYFSSLQLALPILTWEQN